MIRRIRGQATYANVVASIALFVAIGGTSYAAITLPRNSVGAQQIKPRAVGSSELRTNAVRGLAIKNGTIRVHDLAGSTRQSLMGKPGPPGSPGAPAAELRAAVDSSAGLVSGNATSVGGAGTGKRLVGFSQSVAGCVPIATLARNAGGPIVDPGRGYVVVAIEGDRVAVETYTAAGMREFLPFNLIVAC